MSQLASTQISPPSDEQAFERASVILWQCLLDDPNVQRVGRRGQDQQGVDVYGYRNRDPHQLVGVQCKLKGPNKQLTEKEVREELEKALTFEPPLREYFITTTAPNDVDIQELARKLELELLERGRTLAICIWGWNTLEERISGHYRARRAFDPTYGVFGDQLLQELGTTSDRQLQTFSELKQVKETLTSLQVGQLRIEQSLERGPNDTTIARADLDAHLDAEIDSYRGLLGQGKRLTALHLLENLLSRISSTASGRILFRIKANLGHCHLQLGDDQAAIRFLNEAFDHAPTEPKAIANKALSLLLQKNYDELLVFGLEKLGADPTNDSLAAYVIHAARLNHSIEAPWNLVPATLLGTALVQTAKVNFLRSRERIPEWWHAARELRKSHPTEELAKRFGAEADIDEVTQDEVFKRTWVLTPHQKKLVEEATVELLHEWNKALESEGARLPDDLAVGSNLAIAYRILGDVKNALATARECLRHSPEDEGLITNAAKLAVEARDDSLIDELIPRLPVTSESVAIQFGVYCTRGEWNEVVKLGKERSELIPQIERSMIETAVGLAELMLRPLEDNTIRLSELFDNAKADIRACILIAGFSRRLGNETIALAAYQRAKALVTDHITHAERFMIAMHAAKLKEWRDVCDLLDGYITEEYDSSELREVAIAYANDHPVRDAAVRFFKRLPASIRDTEHFLQAAGLMHFNRGDLASAERSLTQAIAQSQDLTSYLALIGLFHRANTIDRIGPLVEGVDLSKVTGTPGQKMYLAQVLRQVGLVEKALAYGYSVLRNAQNNPTVALRYLGLLLSSPSETVIPSLDKVGPDSWVSLEKEGGEKFSFVIEEGDDRPAEGILSAKHPIAAAATGHKVDDTFTIKQAHGGQVTWRIAELKHKYVAALHDVLHHFETRFPDADGFYQVDLPPGDITPVLDKIREQGERNRTLADVYLVRSIPLGMVASKIGNNPISFAEYIRSLNQPIRTCIGNEPERANASVLIRDLRENGAVLDTYAVWTAATLGIFDVLKSVFGELSVPQSVVDELNILLNQVVSDHTPSMTIAWHDGKYIRQEISAEEMKTRKDYIEDVIAKVRNNCTVEPVNAPDQTTEVENILTDTFGPHVLDSAYLLKGNQLLLSEDMHFRHITTAATGIKAVWFQPVLSFARTEGLISDQRYAEAILGLAKRNHSYLSVDTQTMVEVLRADNSEELVAFSAVAEFIGTADADIRSHLSVVQSFLSLIWSRDEIVPLKERKATSAILMNLIRFRSDGAAWLVAFLRYKAPTDLREFMKEWVKGHFLPANQIDKLELDFLMRDSFLRAQRVFGPPSN